MKFYVNKFPIRFAVKTDKDKYIDLPEGVTLKVLGINGTMLELTPVKPFPESTTTVLVMVDILMLNYAFYEVDIAE